MFRSLCDHYQAFLQFKSINASYMLGSQLYLLYNILVLIVNIVGIPTCSQHLLTWFARRPDDGHIRTKTCSLTHNKIWCVWHKLFYHFNNENCTYVLSLIFLFPSYVTHNYMLFLFSLFVFSGQVKRAINDGCIAWRPSYDDVIWRCWLKRRWYSQSRWRAWSKGRFW